jgi:hypothetical protein
MSPARDLPARPSLDSLRKQAKKLARDAAAGNAAATARIQAQLPRATLPLSNRDAQLVIAREYGFAGWPELTAEVQKRLGRGLDWAAGQAKVAIHDRDHDRLRTLLREFPALVSWRDERGETLSSAITPYALDVSDPARADTYTRPIAAEMLIDAGLKIERATWEYLIHTGAAGMLQLLARKGVLPRTLPVLAALGDEEAIRAWFSESHGEQETDRIDERILISRALMNACRFKHAGVALWLLDRAIALDPHLGQRIDRWQGRRVFVDFLIQHPASWGTEGPETTLWQAFVIRQLTNALDRDDLVAFGRWLQDESWVLGETCVNLQVKWIERASYGKDRERFITTLLEHDPALLGVKPPPASPAITYALSYGNAHLVPLLTRIWPLPNDLPHAAGTGDVAAVSRWFDAKGQPVLGSLADHYPADDPKRADLGWDALTIQHVLDVALAWAVLNRHFEIASFLLERGANIDTNWGTHEPASILHEAAIQGSEPAVRFLVDHHADLAIEDYRYRSNAEGWARYGSGDERMATLLAAAAAERKGE